MARIDRMTTSGDLAVLSVRGYFQRMCQRPAVARALDEELALYKQEQERRAA